MSWLKDLLFGKIDPNPVYDGLEERRRRKAHARSEFLKDKKRRYAAELESSIEQAMSTRAAQAFSDRFAYKILSILYDKNPEKHQAYDASLEDSVLNEFLHWIHISDDPRSRIFQQAFARADEDHAVRFFLPSLFDERLFARWDKIKAAYQAEEERVKALKKADANNLAIIEDLRQQVRNMRSLFFSLPDGSQEKYRAMFRIEALQSGIDDVKSKLNVPIPKVSEDWG